MRDWFLTLMFVLTGAYLCWLAGYISGRKDLYRLGGDCELPHR